MTPIGIMSQPTQCVHIATGEGMLRLPFEPLAHGRARRQRAVGLRLVADLRRAARGTRTAAVIVVVEAGRGRPDVAVRGERSSDGSTVVSLCERRVTSPARLLRSATCPCWRRAARADDALMVTVRIRPAIDH